MKLYLAVFDLCNKEEWAKEKIKISENLKDESEKINLTNKQILSLCERWDIQIINRCGKTVMQICPKGYGFAQR